MFPSAPLQASLRATLADDLLAFAPELILVATILGVLLARLVPKLDRVHLVPVATLATVAAAVVAGVQWAAFDDKLTGNPAFAGLLRLDTWAGFLRLYLLAFAVLVLILSRLTGIPDAADSADFVTLFLGGILGMCLMASADHLLMLFLAVEMASLPGYVLSGFLKGKSRGSEAALKYVVTGAAASGVMLYGISLLAGRFGTGSLPLMAKAMAVHTAAHGVDVALAAGLLCLLAGFAFKLAAVPVHFWLPDVFAGAAAEVGAVLAVGSKAAAVGLLVRVLFALKGPAADPHEWTATVGVGLAVVAAITATVGNLLAFGQTELKRLLAYSTVAHAGYMLMAVAAMTTTAAAAVLYYLVAYLFATLAAFAAVAIVRNRTGGEELSSLRGLVRRSPAVGIGLAVAVASLLGLPPFGGFAGKLQLFSAVYDAGGDLSSAGYANAGMLFRGLLAVGVVNTVVSAGYYLKVIREMVLEGDGEAEPLGESTMAGGYLLLLAAGSLVVGVVWNPVTDAALAAAKALAG